MVYSSASIRALMLAHAAALSEKPWQQLLYLLKDCFPEFSGKYYPRKANAWSFWHPWQPSSRISMSLTQWCWRRSMKCFRLARTMKHWSSRWKYHHAYGVNSIYRTFIVSVWRKTSVKFVTRDWLCLRNAWLHDTSWRTPPCGCATIATGWWWMRSSNFWILPTSLK